MNLNIVSVENGWVVTSDETTQVVEIRDEGTKDEYQRHQAKALVRLLHEVSAWARMTDGPDMLSDHNRYGVEIKIKDRGVSPV